MELRACLIWNPGGFSVSRLDRITYKMRTRNNSSPRGRKIPHKVRTTFPPFPLPKVNIEKAIIRKEASKTHPQCSIWNNRLNNITDIHAVSADMSDSLAKCLTLGSRFFRIFGRFHMLLDDYKRYAMREISTIPILVEKMSMISLDISSS